MIRIVDFRKSFGSVVAVDGLSMTVQEGELLLGPNGAGKTTTVREISGLLKANAGSVHIEGKPPTDLSVRDKIGLAPQDLPLYMDLSAEENLVFLGKLYGLFSSLLIMAMLGGAMVPEVVMPPFAKTISNYVPVKWAIMAMEGPIRRDFSFGEMLPFYLKLTIFGMACYVAGVFVFRQTENW